MVNNKPSVKNTPPSSPVPKPITSSPRPAPSQGQTVSKGNKKK